MIYTTEKFIQIHNHSARPQPLYQWNPFRAVRIFANDNPSLPRYKRTNLGIDDDHHSKYKWAVLTTKPPRALGIGRTVWFKKMVTVKNQKTKAMSYYGYWCIVTMADVSYKDWTKYFITPELVYLNTEYHGNVRNDIEDINTIES